MASDLHAPLPGGLKKPFDLHIVKTHVCDQALYPPFCTALLSSIVIWVTNQPFQLSYVTKNSRMEWDLPLPFPMSAWDFLAFKRTVLKIIHLLVEFHIKFRLNSPGTKRQKTCCCTGVRGRIWVRTLSSSPLCLEGWGSRMQRSRWWTKKPVLVFVCFWNKLLWQEMTFNESRGGEMKP